MHLSDVLLPYCVDQYDDGTCMVLNREYKPLSVGNRSYTTPPDMPVRHALYRFGPKRLHELAHDGKVHDNSYDGKPVKRVYLYADGSRPLDNWERYVKRLHALAKLQVLMSSPASATRPSRSPLQSAAPPAGS